MALQHNDFKPFVCLVEFDFKIVCLGVVREIICTGVKGFDSGCEIIYVYSY